MYMGMWRTEVNLGVIPLDGVHPTWFYLKTGFLIGLRLANSDRLADQ